MAKYPYLTRVGKRGTLKYRRAVPALLRDAIGRREIVESFRTNNLNDALPHYHALAEDIDQIFAKARADVEHGVRPADSNRVRSSRSKDIQVVDLDAMATEYREVVCDREMNFRRSTTHAFHSAPERLRRGELVQLPRRYRNAPLTPMIRQRLGKTWTDEALLAEAYEERLWTQIEFLDACCANRDTQALQIHFLKQDVLPGVHQLDEIGLLTLANTERDALETILAGRRKMSGHTSPGPSIRHIAHHGSEQPSATPTLSSVIDAWVCEVKTANGRLSDEREHLLRVVMRDFISVCDDRPIDTYQKSDGRAFKDALLRMPANVGKLPELRGIKRTNIERIVKTAEKRKLTPQSTTSVNKKLGIANQCFKWLGQQYDECAINPVEGLAIKTGRSARDERQPFTLDQLQTIFEAPIYTGCRSERSWADRGTTCMRHSAKFWVPLIGLFTGMRLNEICQLDVENVRRHGDVRYFALTPDLRLKNAASVRNVPIHSALVAAGFLDFCKARHNGRLFPELVEHRSGRFSDGFGKHFNRFLDTLGIKQTDQDFHSFRHNFADAASLSGMEHFHSERLVGHTIAGQAGRYGKKYSVEQQDMDLLEVRNVELQKLRYPHLKLGHLIQQ